MVEKLVLDIDEETWKEVWKYKIDANIKKINDAVVELIKKGLGIKKGD